MPWGGLEGMLGLVDRIGDEPAGMLVGQPVVDAGAFVPSADHAGESELGQVLRYGGRRLADGLGQITDGEFAVAQRQDDADPGRVGQHGEHLDGEVDERGVDIEARCLRICMHTKILTQSGGPRNTGRSRYGVVMTAPTRDPEPSIGQLVAAIKDDIAALVRGEIDLAKAELRGQAKAGGAAIGMLAAAAVIALFAVAMLSVAAAYGLHALGLGLGWSYLIVGGFYLVVTGALLMIARTAFGKLEGPARTQRSAKEIAAALKRTDDQ